MSLDEKISQLPAFTTPLDDDLIAIVDSVSGETKKIKYSDFIAGVGMTVNTSNGTYSHTNGTSEETVLELTANEDNTTVSYDVSLMAQTFTVRVKEKMDGSNYEIQSEKVFPTDFDANIEAIIINLLGKGRDQIITFQSGTAEGSNRDIPFSRRDEVAS